MAHKTVSVTFKGIDSNLGDLLSSYAKAVNQLNASFSRLEGGRGGRRSRGPSRATFGAKEQASEFARWDTWFTKQAFDNITKQAKARKSATDQQVKADKDAAREKAKADKDTAREKAKADKDAARAQVVADRDAERRRKKQEREAAAARAREQRETERQARARARAEEREAKRVARARERYLRETLRNESRVARALFKPVLQDARYGTKAGTGGRRGGPRRPAGTKGQYSGFDNLAALGTAAWVTDALGEAAIGAVKHVVGEGVTYEHALARLNALSGGHLGRSGGLQRLGASARGLGRETQFTPVDVVHAQQIMTQAGFTEGEIQKSLRPVLNFAISSEETLAASAQMMSDAGSAFGVHNSNLEKTGNIVARVALATKTSASNVADSLKTAGGAMHTLGFSMEDAGEVIGVLSHFGVRGKEAGHSMKSIYANLSGFDTKRQQRALKALGLTNKDIQATFGEGRAQDVWKLIGTRFEQKGIKGADRNKVLRDLFTKYQFVRAGYLVQAAMSPEGASQNWTRTARNTRKQTVDLQMMADIQKDAARGDLYTLTSAWQDFSITMSESVLPALRPVLQDLGKLVHKWSDWSKDHPQTTANLIKLVGVLGGVAKVSSVALTGFTGIAAVKTLFSIGRAGGGAALASGTLGGASALRGVLSASGLVGGAGLSALPGPWGGMSSVDQAWQRYHEEREAKRSAAFRRGTAIATLGIGAIMATSLVVDYIEDKQKRKLREQDEAAFGGRAKYKYGRGGLLKDVPVESSDDVGLSMVTTGKGVFWVDKHGKRVTPGPKKEAYDRPTQIAQAGSAFLRMTSSTPRLQKQSELENAVDASRFSWRNLFSLGGTSDRLWASQETERMQAEDRVTAQVQSELSRLAEQWRDQPATKETQRFAQDLVEDFVRVEREAREAARQDPKAKIEIVVTTRQDGKADVDYKVTSADVDVGSVHE